METKNIYIKEIDLIFSILDKIESAWDNSDNLNLISELKKYKNVIVNKTPKGEPQILEVLDAGKVEK